MPYEQVVKFHMFYNYFWNVAGMAFVICMHNSVGLDFITLQTVARRQCFVFFEKHDFVAPSMCSKQSIILKRNERCFYMICDQDSKHVGDSIYVRQQNKK